MANEQSAAENLGPQLLGRIPSPPDERDFKLSDYLGSDEDIVNRAIAELKQTTVGYAGHKRASWPGPTTHWGKAMSLLHQIAPVNPTPTPTPSPSPSPSPSPAPTPTGDVVYADNEAVLDQGNYGTCVGNGWAQWGNTNPIDDKYTEKDARAIYYDATVFDGQPDNPDAPGGGQQGSTVRSGAKAMQKRNRLSAYAFASSLDEIKQFVQSGKGPVVIGSDWTNDMFNPDASYYVQPTGGVAGGHCYLLVGDLESEGAFLFQNSWGSSWGDGGRFKMKYEDFQTLFNQQGEACAAVELALA